MKAYLLFSGGIDSIIAAELLKKLGFEVIAVNIVSPFFERDRETLEKIAQRIGVRIIFIEAGDDYLLMLKNPKYGYGKNMNPCIDCKAYMLRKVKEIAGENIIATGDVLGQRPMSQRRDAFRAIEKLAGLEGRVLRPLSGKLLPETVYEREGIVKRENLLDLKGRSRRRHYEILREMGLEPSELPTPAGGCLLTDPSFSRRLKDLMENGELNWDNVKLLKVGRHFRVNGCKFVLGRNREENEKLRGLEKRGDIIFRARNVPGPVGLLRCREVDERTVEMCASILSRYCSKASGSVDVAILKNGKLLREVKAEPLRDAERFLVR